MTTSGKLHPGRSLQSRSVWSHSPCAGGGGRSPSWQTAPKLAYEFLQIIFTVGNECFRYPEVLFQPSASNDVVRLRIVAVDPAPVAPPPAFTDEIAQQRRYGPQSKRPEACRIR